jgi:pyruvate-formate lyase-activating enzyme
MLAAGTVAATIANYAPFLKEGTKPVSPLDFVPDYKKKLKEQEPKQTLEEQIQILTAVMGCGPGKPTVQ